MDHRVEKEVLHRMNQLHRMLRLAYYAIVGLYCLWVLSLPVLPTQDGPLHLYYVNVLRHLLAQDNALYSGTYTIGRYIPPYSLYYYGLIGLGHFTSLENADKIMACLFFVVFAAGARKLLRVVMGTTSDLPSFLVLPILLNWPLMMGFLNYSLATGMACFALAAWCRGAAKPGWKPRALFLFLLLLLLLTHPVPWIFVEGFAFFDLGLRLLRGRVAGRTFWFADMATALAGAAGYFFLRSFHNVAAAAAPPDEETGSLARRVLNRIKQYVAEHGIAIFADGHRPATLVYRFLLAGLIAALIVLAVRALRLQWREQPDSMQTTWSLFAILFLLLMPFIPPSLNGSAFFANRLLLPLYLSLLLGAAPLLRTGRLAAMLAGVGTAFSLLVLALAVKEITPVAKDVASVANLPVLHTDQPGLLVAHLNPLLTNLSFNPYFWSGAAYTRQHNLLLYNTAWLELAIIPVKLTTAGKAKLDPAYYPEAPRYGNMAFANPEARRMALDRSAFLLGPVSAGTASDDLRNQTPNDLPEPDLQGWRCTRQPFWELCTKR